MMPDDPNGAHGVLICDVDGHGEIADSQIAKIKKVAGPYRRGCYLVFIHITYNSLVTMRLASRDHGVPLASHLSH